MSRDAFKTYTSPEGITLAFWKYTAYRVVQSQARIVRAISGAAKDIENGLDVFSTVFSHLSGISFALTEDAPEWAKEFEAWWVSGAQKSFDEQDFAAVWEGYIDLDILPVQKVLSEAFVKTRRSVLPAPVEIEMGSKAKTESDPDFLSEEAPL